MTKWGTFGRFSLCALMLALAAAPARAEKLTVWHTENDPQTLAALEAIKKRFEATRPGLEVEMIFAGWDDLYQRLTIAIRSGKAPDLTQIEPFMAAYLHRAGQLTPLDDILGTEAIDDIYPALRDLQLFDSKRYGLPTAWGISFYSYRRDLLPTKGELPRTWEGYLKFVTSPEAAAQKRAPLLLPANNLHVTLLFTELLASNGGSLFDGRGRPDFKNPRVLETLRQWKAMYDLVPDDLRNSTYAENFVHYARGRSLSLPGFFGRGTTLIERQAPEEDRTPEKFSLLPYPVGPSGTRSYATLDAEPWVILKGSPNPELAREFLRFFYRPENYLEFCRSVPLHLLPVFKKMATSREYQADPHVRRWKPYYDQALAMMDEQRVLPIFMSKPEDRLNPGLFKLEGSQIILNMVRDVTVNGRSPEEAAEAATAKASSLLEDLPGDAASGGSLSIWWWVGGAVVLLSLPILAVIFRRRAGGR